MAEETFAHHAKQILHFSQHFSQHYKLMAQHVPLLYQELNRIVDAKDAAVKDTVKQILDGQKWIWVGDTFVGCDRAAFN